MAFALLQVSLPAQTAAGATSVTQMGEVPVTFAQATYDVQRVSVSSPTLVTGTVAPNNATFNFRNLRAGSPVGTFATVTFAVGINMAAETPTAVVSGTSTAITVNAGDLIDCQMVQNGTGLAIPAGVVAKVELA